jgi:hypothetical protein
MANSRMIGFRVKPDLEQSIREAAARERRVPSDWIRCRLEDAVVASQAAAAQQQEHAR